MLILYNEWICNATIWENIHETTWCDSGIRECRGLGMPTDGGKVRKRSVRLREMTATQQTNNDERLHQPQTHSQRAGEATWIVQSLVEVIDNVTMTLSTLTPVGKKEDGGVSGRAEESVWARENVRGEARTAGGYDQLIEKREKKNEHTHYGVKITIVRILSIIKF